MDNTNTPQPTNQVPVTAQMPVTTPQITPPPQATPTVTYTTDSGSSKKKIVLMLALLVVICALVAGGAYFYMKSQTVSKQSVKNTETTNQPEIADIFAQLEMDVKAMESETLGIDTEFTEIDSDISSL
ncbi:MAG: hypothetical protein US86_C0003G0061 [Candidatus Daviesbacteria bacterium GW2011_GWA2_38_24]|uniref:Uncharacterized protein n=1 Tax=Candidatus Daviesbacteria bacterium GW2011_GWA2_38_24 TaxID=1618422 RepID=A0A0G0JGM9_9BACT|nr:MAG: hypothetical protein US86_C0003G0061 [Candidatus Daviesbacteria bacterium GW2011_GWA2_38_24]OGE24072.1 MAG: hypothetical protein A2688_01290 [Candidatus Daviesbacteria bacterium RIFCSPHIGHO2_01_FULL_38_8]